MLVVIAGAGTVGTYLLESFSGEEIKIILIEKDLDKLSSIGENYDVLAVEGDMLSHYILRQANVAAADIFIASSNVDSVNILACQLAKRLGAKKCIARVYSEDIFPYEVADLESHLGVDWLVSPSRLAGYKLAYSLFDNSQIAFDNYFASRLDIVKIKVNKSSSCYNKKIKSWMPNKYVSLLAVYRHGEVLQLQKNKNSFLPQVGDEIVLVGRLNCLPKKLSNFFPDTFNEKQPIYFAGTSKSALSALSLLDNKKHITVFERDLKVAKEVEERYEVAVQNVDPAIFNKLKDLDLNRKGMFVCGSEDDAENLTYALNAQDLGFKNIIPIVQGGERMRFFERLSFNTIVSPCALAAKEIFSYANQTIHRDFNLIKGLPASAIVKEIGTTSMELGKNWEELRNFYDDNIAIVAVWKNGKIYLFGEKHFSEIENNDMLLLSSLTGDKKLLASLYS